MFLKGVISNSYFIVFFFALAELLVLLHSKKQYRIYFFLIPICFLWRLLLNLESERYSIILSVPIIILFSFFCFSSNKFRYFKISLYTLLIFFFFFVLFSSSNDNFYILDASDLLSFYSKRLNVVTIDHTNNNAKRLNFYSNSPVYDTNQVITNISSDYLVFDNEIANYNKSNRVALLSIMSDKALIFKRRDHSYKLFARMFTNSKKNKIFYLFGEPDIIHSDHTSSYIVQTDFNDWVKYGYKYHVTDTSLLKPITHIPTGWTPTIGDGYYKDAFATFEKYSTTDNHFLHLSSKREAGFFTEGVLPFNSDLSFTASLVSLAESRFNLVVYLFDNDKKYCTRGTYFTFFLPSNSSLNDFNCVIPKELYLKYPFAKIAFELVYGDILIDSISISSM